MPLIERVFALLEQQGIASALIGAGALAVHGVSRATQDIDLLTTDARALLPGTWALLEQTAADVRHGDADDPLLGVVRLSATGDRDVDVIVGRDAWQRAAIARARVVPGSRIPVVEAADVILLKLYAGGTQDRWDIEQLLSAGQGDSLVRIVEERLSALPERSRILWRELSRAR